ncbi:MAG: nucleotide sugar dehydrogenase [Acidimicrobiales bacterium]
MKVAVFGLGYVGTVTAAVLAANRHDVRGVDVDPGKVQLVAAGRSPVLEPGLDGLIGEAVRNGHLRATEDAAEALEDAEISLVCVGTPSASTGSTELEFVLRAVGNVLDALAAGRGPSTGHHSVVVRSTVPPGTVDGRLAPVVAERLGDAPFAVGTGMCPEFLREGSAIADFYDAPFTVVGTGDPKVAATVQRLLSFLPTPVREVPTRDAEGLKYACNAFHATKVSFANELGRLFRALGVDSRLVMDLFCEDTKLNISASYLAPGFAFGGSCLPKDLRSLLYLARMRSIDLPLLSGTLASNERSVGDVVNRVLATDARTVALLGLSFKGDSDDLRESPYVDLAETLIGKGFEVRIFDPLVDTSRLVGANLRHLVSKLPHVQRALRPSPAEALAGADLALVSSADPSVASALVAHPPAVVIDLCGRLGPAVEALPNYQGVAW